MVFRLIPACAGKTKFQDLVINGDVAHPRVCGENVISDQYADNRQGSSPRVRGKQGGL